MEAYDVGAQAMRELTASFAEVTDTSWNEAETRFHVVDELLTKCLQWPRRAIEVERSHDGTFTDYELGHVHAQVVVEAKRVGSWFALPVGNKSLVRPLPTLTRGNSELLQAVDQVTGYCARRGIKVAVLCNGPQLLAFHGVRLDGVPPREGKALCFESLDAADGNFQALWDALSPAGINAGRLDRLLLAEDLAPPPAKMAAWLSRYPGHQRRNLLQERLELLGEIFFEDFEKLPERQEEFLRACYCKSGALSQYSAVSRQILETRYSNELATESGVELSPATTKSGVSEDLHGSIGDAALSKRPIILVGDVGAGKTTFIKNLILVDAKKQLQESIVIYVDLGVNPALVGDIGLAIERQIEHQLLANYEIDIMQNETVRGVYHSDLQRFKRGIYGSLVDSDPVQFKAKEIAYLDELISDRPEHIRRMLDHVVRAQRRQVVIFLDNIDQRESRFQEEVFLKSQALAEQWPATVFVSLRPETLFVSKRKGSLSGYNLRVFYISPPRIDQVIERRLEFALSQLESHGVLPLAPEGVSLASDSLVAMLRVIQRSLNVSEQLSRMIDNLSRGNVRDALDWMVEFMGSGHVNTQKIIDADAREAAKNSRGYIIPVHEFLRAILFGDYEYYDPGSSPIPNIFDLMSRDVKEHFAVPELVKYLDTSAQSSSREGFVEIRDIFSHLQNLGLTATRIEWAIERAVENGLAEPSPRGAELADVDLLRITARGAYIVSELVRTFAYLDGVIVDLPVVDDRVRESLADERSMPARIARAEAVIDYLDAAWAPWNGSEARFDWPSTSAALRSDVLRAGRSAKRRGS